MRFRSIPTIMVCATLWLACATPSSEDRGTANSTSSSTGEDLFDQHCTLCHGGDGTLQLSGASDLSTSDLERENVLSIISNGRGAMMPYKQQLDKKELDLVADHVLSLRK